jgi:4-hydroxy-tetrahydrodipicolinate synthase
MPLSSPNEVSSREMNQLKSEHPHLTCHLWTALITPFNADGQIDFVSLRHIAAKQEKSGNGILLLGSTGEGLALSAQEQLSIVEAVCQLKLKVPLMVAVGGHQLSEQIRWIEQCNKFEISAFLLGAPLYAKPGSEGQKYWFDTLLSASKYPCMLYNVPSRSGISLSVQTLSELQSHPNFWALKEASGDINQFLQYRRACPEIELFSGEDNLMPYLAMAGAKGLVSVCANVWPEPTNEYVLLCLAGQSEMLFPIWHDATLALFCVANPIPAKALMVLNQDIQHAGLRPPLVVEELAHADDLHRVNESIFNWFKSYRPEQTSPAFIKQASA